MMYDLIINGCSFTKYVWPTWADFLCIGFDNRINIGNWAMGSDYVLHTTYPYIKNSSNDTKFILNWPFYSKWDNKKDGEWNRLGNVANIEYKSKKIQDHYLYFYDDDYWFEKTSLNIQIMNDILKSKPNKYWFTSAVDYSKDHRGKDLSKIYNQENFLEKNFYQLGLDDKENAHVWKKGRFGAENQYDWHPCCTTQLKIAKKISGQTGIEIQRGNWEEISKDIDNRIRKCDDLMKFKPITLEEYI